DACAVNVGRFRAPVFWAAALAAVLMPAAACAQDSAGARDGRSSPPSPPSEATSAAPPSAAPSWYGWQALLVDAAATAPVDIGAASAKSGGLAVALAGAGIYAVGGPIIHAAHHRWAAMGGSLGLRLLLPAPGIVAIFAVATRRAPADEGSLSGCCSIPA